jgi:hypothetical protein
LYNQVFLHLSLRKIPLKKLAHINHGHMLRIEKTQTTTKDSKIFYLLKYKIRQGGRVNFLAANQDGC